MNKFLPVLILLLSPPAYSDNSTPMPKLEWGAGAVMFNTPDYIGSNYSQTVFAPFPFLKYRGEYLHIDDGVEAWLFNTPDLLLSISGNGALPAPEDTPLRKGMDKLDASIEFGPSIEYRLTHNESTSIWLEVPLRVAFSISKNPSYIGKTFHPKIAWRKPAKSKYDWKLRLAGGPLYADEKFSGYYYNVQEHEVTDDRPAFNSDKGYLGFRTDFTYSKRIGKYWLGGFIRNDNIRNSVIEDSPLVTETNNWTAGIALAWVISDL